MYGHGPDADEGARSRGKRPVLGKKRPERTTSVPCHCDVAQQPGRGADPRFPLGPPLMLSPVALPGTVALDGISGPIPSIVPSGREETYGPPRRPAIGLSTTGLEVHPQPTRLFPPHVHKEIPRLRRGPISRPATASRDRTRRMPKKGRHREGLYPHSRPQLKW